MGFCRARTDLYFAWRRSWIAFLWLYRNLEFWREQQARVQSTRRGWYDLSSLIFWIFGTSYRVTMPFDWIKHHSGQGLCCLYRASMCFFHFVSVVPSPACSGLWDSMSATPLLLLVLLAAPDLNRKTRIRVVPAGPGSQAPGWDRMPQWKWEDTIATYARKNSKRDAG